MQHPTQKSAEELYQQDAFNKKESLPKIIVAFPADLWYMFVLRGGDGMNKTLTALYDSFYT
ncbi:MAG: hypothetical protein K2K53_13025, partial [Oscillospiraceae bacterium]|nr:hypothetical protein [Oscillospiraceae bacterium]